VSAVDDQYLSVSTDADGTVIVQGEVDLYSAPVLERVVGDAVQGGDGDVVIDLSGVRFMDSAGLNILIRSFKPLNTQGRRLVLRSPQTAVRRTLELAGIVSLVHLEG
jgi:anti-sigma B factor antagonist